MKPRYKWLGIPTVLIGAVAATLSGPWLPDPPSPAALVQPRALQEDLDFLHARIASGVPTYGLFRPRRDLDALFASIRARLDRPMTPTEFWRVLTPAVTAVGDGHLSLSPSPATFVTAPHDRMLPLSVRFAGSRLIVRRNLSDANIPAGSEILSVNGLRPARVVAACAPYISRSPQIQSRLLEKVARQLSQQCGIATGMRPPYRVAYTTPGRSEARVATVDGVTEAEYGSRYQARFPSEKDEPPLELKLLPAQQSALLTIRTFQDSDGFDFKQALTQSFAEVRASGARSLIVDLRNNPGGPDSAGALLFGLLARKPFLYVERREMAAGFRPIIWNSSDRPLVLMELVIPKRRIAAGGYLLRDDIDRIQSPDPHAFTGPIYALIDGTSFSTAANVATLIKHERRGLLIGEEAGSGYAEDSGGTFDLTLPNTGLIAVLPVVRYRFQAGPENPPLRGALPDIAVPRAASDVTGDTDSILETAMAASRRERHSRSTGWSWPAIPDQIQAMRSGP